MTNQTTAAPHMPIIRNGQWICYWCGRVLRQNRKITSCQGVRKLISEALKHG